MECDTDSDRAPAKAERRGSPVSPVSDADSFRFVVLEDGEAPTRAAEPMLSPRTAWLLCFDEASRQALCCDELGRSGEPAVSPGPPTRAAEEPHTTARLLGFDVASRRALCCGEPLRSPDDGALLPRPEERESPECKEYSEDEFQSSSEDEESLEDVVPPLSPLEVAETILPGSSPEGFSNRSAVTSSAFTDVAAPSPEHELRITQLKATKEKAVLELTRASVARACISALHRQLEAASVSRREPDLQDTSSLDGGKTLSRSLHLGSFHSTPSAAWPALSAGPLAVSPTRPPGDRLDTRALQPRHQRRRWVEEPGPLHAALDPRALRAADQQKLRANFNKNSQKVKGREARDQSGARVAQALHFRLREQEIERECRSTEKSWHSEQEARLAQSLRRREELANSGEQNLNRLYGRMPLYGASASEEAGVGGCSVAEAWEQVTVRFGEESRPPMPSMQGRRLTAEEAAAHCEPPLSQEHLERFLPHYLASTGRRLAPEPTEQAAPMVSFTTPVATPSRRPRSKGSLGDTGSANGMSATPPPPGPPPGRAAWQSVKNRWVQKRPAASAHHMVRELVAQGGDGAGASRIRLPAASPKVPARPFKGPPIFVRSGRQLLPPVVPSHPGQTM